MKSDEILILGAIGIGVYLYSRQSKTLPQRGIQQTSPLSNNPLLGTDIANQSKKVTDAINAGKGAFGALKDVYNGVSGAFDRNNNATGNPSFDALDDMGKISGGWGTGEDVEAMTV